jgi:hypothetical protein
MGGEGDKGECWRVEFKYVYLTHCENFCKCHNVPQPSTTITTKKFTGYMHISNTFNFLRALT